MNIIVADYSGFCFGVKKAVSTAYDIESGSGNIYTYGPIIHNSAVVNELESKGVKQLKSIDELSERDTVIIRSHGVSRDIIRLLNEKKVNIVDATCPNVDNIHKKVEDYYNRGYRIIIIGDPNHPEVVGINGWCENSALVIDSIEKAEYVNYHPKTCIVSQTTMDIEKWKIIVSSLIDVSKETVIFNTICNATEQRQKSVRELAQKCGAVIVLGGYDSSNTKKLADISREFCPRTYHVENINELDVSILKGIKTIGITAGASTPEWIIKEAVNKMSNLTNTNEENNKQENLTNPSEENNEQDKLTNSSEENSGDDRLENSSEESNEQNMFMDEYEKTLIRLHDGDIVKGRIIYVTENEATVDVGYKADGIIPKEEILLDEGTSIKDVLSPDQEVNVYVLKVNDGEGNVLLSKKRVDAQKNVEYIEDSYKNKTTVNAKVTQAVKGGVTAEVKGVRVFIPASQLDTKYVEDMSVYVGKTLKIAIIEFDEDKRKIIGSRRVVLTEEINNLKKSKLESIQPGDILSGTVSRLTDFGAFVDLGGIDGLIHISELSWGRIKHPSQVVKTGDKVEVYVLAVDKEKERISLSLRKTVADPWESIGVRIHTGDIIEGKVVRLVSFGAFVEIESGIDGLVHISQISDKRVNKVEDVLKVGDIIKAKVVELNLDEKRVSLSIREAAEDEMKKENTAIIDKQEQDNVTVADIIDEKKTEE